MSADATQRVTATIEMKVVRQDGTVEYYDADVTDLNEEAIKTLIADQSKEGQNKHGDSHH